MNVLIHQLLRLLLRNLTDCGKLRTGLLNIGFVAALALQTFHNLRPEFGHVIGSQKTMVRLVHNIFNIIIKQHIHDFCRRPVLCEFIYVMLDTGI